MLKVTKVVVLEQAVPSLSANTAKITTSLHLPQSFFSLCCRYGGFVYICRRGVGHGSAVPTPIPPQKKLFYSWRGETETPKRLCRWTVSIWVSPPFFDSSMLLILLRRNFTWGLCSHWQGSQLPKSCLSHHAAPLASSSGTIIFHMLLLLFYS